MTHQDKTLGGPCENTDRHLWPEISEPGAPEERLFITKEGALGINCGGYVYVKPIREWHRLAGGPFPFHTPPEAPPNEVAARARAFREQRGTWGSHAEALCAEVERLHEESVQWEKESLCKLIDERNQLRATLLRLSSRIDAARRALSGDSPPSPAPLTPVEMGTIARMAAVSAQVQPEKASCDGKVDLKSGRHLWVGPIGARICGKCGEQLDESGRHKPDP